MSNLKLFLIEIRRFVQEAPWLVATTKYENLPLPPFGKGGMGGFSYKALIKGTEGVSS
jgi:hypothetical protein